MTKTEKVTPFEMEDTVNLDQVRLTMKDIFHKFAAETTAHGIPRIIYSRKTLSKLFWFCLVVGAFTMFFAQTTTLLSNFYAFNTKVKLINSEEVFFPAVTVCNLNKMRKSSLESNERWAELISNDDRLLEHESGQNNNSPPPSTRKASEEQQEEVTLKPRDEPETKKRRRRDNDKEEGTENYDNWYYESSLANVLPEAGPFFFADAELGAAMPVPEKSNTPTIEELKNFGHQGKDFILQCTFNKIPCNYTHFDILQNREYGNCFTFNGKGTISYPRVTKIGSNYGLHLTLNIEQSEYVGSFTDGSGVRLMTHPREILPHPEDVGLSVPPGFSTNIGIRQVEIMRLEAPYGECTDGLRHAYLQNSTYSYSAISCQKKCLLDEMVSKCSCVTDIYDDYTGVPFCTGKEQRKCRQSVEKAFYLNKLGCDCPPQLPVFQFFCLDSEYIYNMQTTSSVWPSTQFYGHLKEKLTTQGKYSSEILEDIYKARENLVRVKIYFQELNYELVEQVPAYTTESVLGTAGGLLGLYVGFSVITISEIFVLIWDICAFLLKLK